MAVLKNTAAALALAAAGVAANIHAAPQDDVLAKLAQVRGLDVATGVEASKQRGTLDEAWRWFGNNKAQALPVLRRELAAELKKVQPNQLLLLEAGYFLRAQGEQSDRALAMQALLAIDPEGVVPRTQGEQLFRFVHASAADRDPRLLPLIDKVFLRGSVTVLLPQYGYTIDETSVCIYLYGQYGAAAEAHLRTLLDDPAVVDRALTVLMWVGSPDSVPAVAALLGKAGDDTFARAGTFLLRAGGPQGRDALAMFDGRRLQGRAGEFYRSTYPQLAQMNFDALARQLVESPADGGGPQLRGRDEAATRQTLAVLQSTYGSYEDIQPIDIALSTMPAAQLIEELVRIRERSLLRLSPEALTDVDTTNTLINTLRFK